MSSFYNLEVFFKEILLPSHCRDISPSSPHLCTDALTLLARSPVLSLWSPPEGLQALGGLSESRGLRVSWPLQPLSQPGKNTLGFSDLTLSVLETISSCRRERDCNSFKTYLELYPSSSIPQMCRQTKSLKRDPVSLLKVCALSSH